MEMLDQVQLLHPPEPQRMYTAILLESPVILPVMLLSFKLVIGMFPLAVPVDEPFS